MKRQERQIVIRVQQLVYKELGLEFKAKRRGEREGEANEIVSKIVDMYEYDKLYCQSKNCIASVLQCTGKTHSNRIDRFIDKHRSHCGYRSKANRVIRKVTKEIEREYGARLPKRKAEELLGSNETEEGSENCDGNGSTAFMATLSALDENEG